MKAAGVDGEGLGGGGAAPDYAQLAESFARDGYVVLEGLLSADQLAAVGASAGGIYFSRNYFGAPPGEGSSGRVRQCWSDERV